MIYGPVCGLFRDGHCVEGVKDDVHSELRIVFRQEAFVSKIVIPFATIILVTIEHADAAVDHDGLEIIMYQVVAPAVEFEGGVGGTFLEMKKAVVDRVVVRDLFEGIGSEDRGHLVFEGAGKETVDIVVAVVGEDKTAVVDITTEIISFPGVELNELVTADIGKWIMKDLGAVQVEDFLLQVHWDSGILDQ